MIYPRLKLLHKLLANDGVIFISIDDNEQANLKLIMDEIFGGGNFIANVVWQKRTSPDSRLNLGPAHDFIVVYAKNWMRRDLHLVKMSEGRTKDYRNPDNDLRGVWASVDLTGQKGHATPSQFYEITTPLGKILKPPTGRCWAIAEKTFIDLVKDNRIWFGKDGDARPRLKKFLAETEGTTVWTWWTNTEVGHNQEAAKELGHILDEVSQFDTPKPSRLIERILQIATDKNSIILDSFAGSGTTAHAVLKLNAEDGGNRKFILIETMDYAETITAERVRRVMNGYGEGTKAVAGVGGSFDYYEIGDVIFDHEGNLNEAIGVDEIRKYIAFTERLERLENEISSSFLSKEEVEGIEEIEANRKVRFPVKEEIEANGKVRSPVNKYLLGWRDETAYFFVYEKDNITSLNIEFLASLDFRPAALIVYADKCLLNKEQLQKYNITFKKIPRDIQRF